MITMGDVLAVVTSLFAICFATWALLLASALLFPSKAEHASDAASHKPWRNLGRGLVVTLVLGTIGVGMLASPLPAAKLIGWVVVLAHLAISALGMAGITLIAAERLQRLEPSLSPYACLVRAAAIMVIPGILPVLGWFLIGPLLLLAGAGAGWNAVMVRNRTVVQQIEVH
jgi:hypothetical protein